MRFFLAASLVLHLLIIYFLYLSNGSTFSAPADVEIAVIENTMVAAPTDLESENIVASPYEKVQKSQFPVNAAETADAAPVRVAQPKAPVAVNVPQAPSAPVQANTPPVKSVSSTDLGLRIKYPRLSRMLSEEGRVVVMIFTNEKGHVKKMSVDSSSGFARLDEAALDAVSNSRVANYDRNSRLKISFLFKLK